MRGRRRELSRVVAGLCLAGLFWGVGSSGCAWFSPSRRAEPGVLVVRNASGRDVDLFRLAPVARRHRNARYGSVSPVPRGVSQVVVRPTDVPPLTDELDVEWSEVGGRIFSHRVDLRPTLRDAVGGPDEALVFELLPDGGLELRLERRRSP